MAGARPAGLGGEGTVESWSMPSGWSVPGLRPHSPTLSPSPWTGATLSSAPLSPQQLCTKFTEFQNQIETGALRVETCQQLAERLLEGGHSAAPKARQRQQDLR